MNKRLLFTAFLALGLNANAQELDIVKNINPTGDSYARGYTKLPNGKFVFSADDGVNGQELWISDGTNSGTELLKDINLGIDDSGPENFILFQDKIYFRAGTADEGEELWVTDGTAAGTQMVKDIRPGASYSHVDRFFIFQNKLFFIAHDGVHGLELWTTDGTTAGTQMLKDINPGSGFSSPSNFIIFNDKLYFNAFVTGQGRELWVTDGTETGTQLVKDINPGIGTGSPENLTIFNNKLYFVANDGINGKELWVSDGTETGTKLFYDLEPGMNSSNILNLIVYNNKLFFDASTSNVGRELWITDGSEENTRMLKDINIGNGGSDPNYFVEFNGKLFFTAYNGVEKTIYQTDGTTFGTVQIFDDFVADNAEYLVKMKDKLYYRDVSMGNYIIKYTNGTYNHSRDIIDMVGVTYNYGQYFYEPSLIINDSVMYLTGDYSSMGREIYKITDVAYASVDEVKADEAFTIFPNPTSSVINISLKGANGTQQVKIFDVTGVEVFSNEYNTNENNILIDVNNLNSGVYFVKINDTVGQKFIKK